MQLSDYLKESELTLTAFAALVGVSVEAVRRYSEGSRIPNRGIMPRIIKATDGKVQPNDFFPPETEAA